MRKAVVHYNMQSAVVTLVGRVSLVFWVQKWLHARHSIGCSVIEHEWTCS